LFAAPHGLSQRTTSFVACACQGIHRTPFRHLIALIVDARSRYRNLKPEDFGSDNGRHLTAWPRSAMRNSAISSSRRHGWPIPSLTEQVLKDQCHTRTARRRRGHAPPAFAGPLRDFRTTLLFTMSMPAQGRQKSENRSQQPAGRRSGFCFLIPMSFGFGGAGAWWSQTGSNRRPPACKAGALPTELWPRQGSAVRDQSSEVLPALIAVG
jgi:hypothetical protein